MLQTPPIIFSSARQISQQLKLERILHPTADYILFFPQPHFTEASPRGDLQLLSRYGKV